MDPYYKKTIEFNYYKHTFRFDVANTIFSTFDIDTGTQLLLRTIQMHENKSLLDLGCGYGALSVILSALYKTSKVTLVDKDMLSLRYAEMNLRQNNILNAEIIPSVGLTSVPSQLFDVIVSNIPAKAGDLAIEQDFILKPLEYLAKDGAYWFVVVTALNRLIPEVGERHKLNLKQIVKKNRYAVYKLVK